MNPTLKLQSYINLELYGDKMLVLSARNEALNLQMCLKDGLWPSSIKTQCPLIFLLEQGPSSLQASQMWSSLLNTICAFPLPRSVHGAIL